MDTGERVYNKATDRQWSSDVYQKAKEVIEKVLTQSGNPVPQNQIRQAMKQEYPSLCDDLIKDRMNPKMPYWHHLVATAISALQKQGKVRKADGGWIWATMAPPYTPTPKSVVTPAPTLAPAVASPPPDIRQQLRDKLFQLDARAFEILVGKVLSALGAHQLRVTGSTADGGVDGEAEIPIWGFKLAFQAKKWAEGNTVGIEPVQRLIGSVVSGRYDRGIFVTTSSFTQGAKEVAEKPDSKIILIDGDKLVDIMVRNCLGIREVPIVKEELDEGFFRSIAP